MKRNIPKVTYQSADKLAEDILKDATDTRVVVGPLVWSDNDNGDKLWYFIISSCGAEGFRSEQVVVPEADRENFRIAVKLALSKRKPITVIDMDNELAMARLCARLWPGPTTKKIREEVEEEEEALK